MKDDLTRIIGGLEVELLQPEVRSNAGRVSELLADDFVEFGESGKRYTKQDVLSALLKPVNVTYSIFDLSVTEISSDVALATYRAQKEDPETGRTSISLRSSLWINRDGKWQMIFHQGTVLSRGII